MDGSVAGVNTFIVSGKGGGSVGLGFAVPVETVRELLAKYRRSGNTDYGWLGVGFAPDASRGAVVAILRSLADSTPGSDVDFLVERSGERVAVRVTLGRAEQKTPQEEPDALIPRTALAIVRLLLENTVLSAERLA